MHDPVTIFSDTNLNLRFESMNATFNDEDTPNALPYPMMINLLFKYLIIGFSIYATDRVSIQVIVAVLKSIYSKI